MDIDFIFFFLCQCIINDDMKTGMKNTGILSVVFWFLFFSISGSAAARDDKGSYSRLAALAGPSVVTVLVYEYSGRFKHVGSGFFYNPKGDIVTNSHVLAANTRAEIKLASGEKYPVGAIIERNEKTDVVKARTHVPEDRPFLRMADRMPSPGDRIMVVGSPLGLEQTITEGIVSAWRKIPGKGNVLQISAPVSPGSSGGPVLNMAGEVVGIASFQIIQGQNLNFAIPAASIFKKGKTNPRKLKFYKNDKGVLIIE